MPDHRRIMYRWLTSLGLLCVFMIATPVSAQELKLTLDAPTSETTQQETDSLRSELSKALEDAEPTKKMSNEPIDDLGKGLEEEDEASAVDKIEIDDKKDTSEANVDVRKLMEPSSQKRIREETREFSQRALAPFTLSPLEFQPRPTGSVVASQASIKEYSWINPAPVSQPTYFDDIDLERYGHVYSFQTLRSGFRFVEDVLLLPLEAYQRPPCSKVYQSGLHRPGDPACPIDENRCR